MREKVEREKRIEGKKGRQGRNRDCNGNGMGWIKGSKLDHMS